MATEFNLEKVKNHLGIELDTLVKYEHTEGKELVREEWCNVMDLDQIFNACVERWGSNWDLNKVITAIKEADFD